MAKIPFQAISLAQLSDGYAGKAIDAALEQIVRDIQDRGEDGIARKVTVCLTLKHVGAGHVEIDTQVTTKVPAYRPPKTTAKLDARAGGLMFNPDCTDNPDQRTFGDLGDVAAGE